MTHNNAKQAVIDSLTHLLADSFVVYFKTHSFHWNVTGPYFKSLHDMFGEQYTELWTATDDMAERIRALGETAAFSMTDIIARSDMNEANAAPDAMAMVKQLAEDNQTLANHLREGISTAEEAGDQLTADMLTGRAIQHEKNAWMLRSTLGE